MNERKDLTTLPIKRRNLLNNKLVVDEAKCELKLSGVPFDGDTYLTKEDVLTFYGVSEQTLNDCVNEHEEELSAGGYRTIEESELTAFREAYEKVQGKAASGEAAQVEIFSFRAFLNVGMLLDDCDAAKTVRALVLNLAIGSISAKGAGTTRFINRRDRNFLPEALREMKPRSQFIDALKNFVAGNQFKYRNFTDKIYKHIFRERANEYRKLLSLPENIELRSTFYADVLVLVASYEKALAASLEERCKELGRVLTTEEADECFDVCLAGIATFDDVLIENARTNMATRDYALRNVYHDALKEYVGTMREEDFERFLGEQSVDFDAELEEAKAVMLRLKAN